MPIPASIPLFQYIASNNRPLSGGKLYSYLAGTDTPTPLYTDSTGTAEHTNPVILDTDGSKSIWFDENISYKLVLKTATGSLLKTFDNLNAIYPLRFGEFVSVKDFGAVGDGVTDDTAAIQDALDSGALSIFIPPGTFLCGPLTVPGTFGLCIWGVPMASALKMRAVSGALFNWSTTGIVYTEGYISGIRIVGTNGVGHCINTSGVGGLTIKDVYIHDIPVGYSGVYIDGANSTYVHDTRVLNLQIYSNTLGHSGVRLGPLSSDTNISNFIMNGNFDSDYCLYLDSGAKTLTVNDSHPYNAAKSIMIMAGGNDHCSFNNVVFDNANENLVNITNGTYGAFTDCYFQEVKATYSGASLVASSGYSFFNCRWTGAVGSASCVVGDSNSTDNIVRGGNIGVAANWTNKFSFSGARCTAEMLAGHNPLGEKYVFSGCTQTSQSQATTNFLGINGIQSTESATNYLVPRGSRLKSAYIAVASTPASGQTFTFQVYKNGSPLGSALVVNNGEFGGTITIDQDVSQYDRISIRSEFSATSGSSNIRYLVNFES